MIDDKNEEKIIIQLDAMLNEFKIVSANMNILCNYFETLLMSFKDRNYLE